MRQFSQPLLDCQSSSWVYTASLAPPGDSAKEYPSFRPPSSGGLWKVAMRSAFLFLLACAAFPRPAVAQTDEIVANLAGGRVIVTVARDAIVFGVINHAVESTSVPPRAAQVDPSHIGIFFGASEWRVPAEPRPIRLDYDLQYVRPNKQAYRPPGAAESDLEQIGIGLLEKLRPLVSQLHRKIDLKPDEPLFSLVLIGYAQNYGPEVWVIDYRAEQEPFGSKDFWQTHILRPRFTQLYPPEKHEPKTLLEVRVPSNLPDVPLLGLIQQNDPPIAHLRSSDPRFGKLLDEIQRGQAQKAVSQDSADFLRAALPLIAGDAHFFEGVMHEDGALEWMVPPEEPFGREQRALEKDRPPDAPTLQHKPVPTKP